MSGARRDRRRAARAAARDRVAARTARPLTEAQRAHDPTDHRRGGAGARAGGLLGLVLGSAATHAALLLAGVLVAYLVPDDDEEDDRDIVAVEMKEREAEPEPEPEPKPDEPPPVPRAVKPPPAAKPPPQQPPPQPEAKAPPRRVVGLSLESTAQGGAGPAFGVGETRAGTTEAKAADPRPKPRTEAPPPAPGPSGSNKAATRIPTSGVAMQLPKRKKPAVPTYPAALKAQGIEADVPVMVSIDATGAVTTVKILKSSGYPELDEAARAAALSESFEPARRDGVAIPYTLSYTYRFRLEDG